ncbi:MAG TPA: hypothetical protein VIK73_07775 [Limnochordales bacterium]
MPAMLPGPDPIGIPAPPWLLQVLLVLTYTLHTLFVGVTLGGTAIGLVSAVAGRAHDELRAGPARLLGAHLSQALPVAMAFSITTGVAPLLFVQVLYGPFFYTASTFVAWSWVSVIPVLIVGYYALYAWALRRKHGPRAPAWGLAVTLGALVWTAFALVNNMSLFPHPERYGELFNLSGTALNVSEPTLWPRYVHALLNLLLVGLSYVLAVGHVAARVAPEPARRVRAGVGRALAVTLVLQAAASAWYGLALVPVVETVPLVRVGIAIAVAGGVVMAAAWLLAERAARSRPGGPGALRWAAGALAGTVAMAAGLAVARHGVRMDSLQPYLQPEMWRVDLQLTPLVLFGLLLVAGLAFVAYMLLRYPWREGLERLQA